jgi:hypothetical protein
VPQFLSSLLQDRQFCVRLNNVFYAINQKTVSQGSVLSVTLLSIAINVMDSAVGPPICISLYFEDVAIY